MMNHQVFGRFLVEQIFNAYNVCTTVVPPLVLDAAEWLVRTIVYFLTVMGACESFEMCAMWVIIVGYTFYKAMCIALITNAVMSILSREGSTPWAILSLLVWVTLFLLI